MKRLALFSLALAACTSNEPPASVQQTFFSQFAAIQSLQAQAIQQQSSFAPLDGNVSFSGACPNGGTVAETGSYSGDGTATNATFDLSLTLGNCGANGVTIDGGWDWSATTTGTSASFSVSSDVTMTSPQLTGHFVEDLTMEFSAQHFAITGSMDVDGNHYDVDFSYPN